MQLTDKDGNIFGIGGLEITTSSGKPKVPVINTDITIGTTAIVNGVVGRILFQGIGNVVQESANLFWDNTGFLGIGTSTPVTPSTYNGITINSVTAGSYVWFQTGSVTKYSVGSEGNVNYHNLVAGTSFLIRSGGSSYFNVVQSTGNVQIGTTTDAGYKLDVNGTAAIRGTTNVIGGTLRIASTGTLTQPSYITSHSDGGWNYTTYTHERGAGVHYFTSNNGSASIFSASAREGVIINVNSLTTGNPFSISGTVNASSAIARGQLINPTLVAAANNDVLIGLDIAPTFTNGAFTGVSNWAMRLYNSIRFETPSDLSQGIFWKPANDGTTLRIYGSTFSAGIGFLQLNVQSGSDGLSVNGGARTLSINAAQSSISLNLNNILFNTHGTGEAARIVVSTKNFLIGTTTDAGFKLDVNGTGRFSNTLTIQTTATGGSPSNSILISTNDAGNGGRISWGDSNTSILRYSNSLYFREYTGNFVFESTNANAIYFSIRPWGTTLSAGPFTTNSSITAASAIARGAYFNNTLVAAANNDVLVGLDVQPTYTNGAFTGVANYNLRTGGLITKQYFQSPTTNQGNHSISFGFGGAGEQVRLIASAAGAVGRGNLYIASASGDTAVATISDANALFAFAGNNFYKSFSLDQSALTTGQGLYIVGNQPASITNGIFFRYSETRVAILVKPHGASGYADFRIAIVPVGGANNPPQESDTKFMITKDTTNVLINTTTDAGYKLDVNGNTRSNRFYANDGITLQRISFEGFNNVTGIDFNSTTGLFKFFASTSNFLSAGFNLDTIISPVRNTVDNLGDVVIQGGGSERARFKANGNVGIGTTTPTALLEVNGSARVQSGLTVSGSLNLNSSDISSAWTTYTPTWSTDGATQPSLGNGTITGAYKVIGKTVFVRVRLVFGTTTTAGTGAFYFSLPVNAAAAWGVQMPVSLLDNGNAWYQATVNGEYGGFTDKVALITQSAGGANSSQGVTGVFPITFASTDSIQFNGSYESV